MSEINQQTIFEIAHRIMVNSQFKHTGHFDPQELSEKFPDNEAVETYINFYGPSEVAYTYGWCSRSIQRLVDAYGEQRLRPIVEYRMNNPLHGGGTAYGSEYLSRSQQLCTLYCKEILETLDRAN